MEVWSYRIEVVPEQHLAALRQPDRWCVRIVRDGGRVVSQPVRDVPRAQADAAVVALRIAFGAGWDEALRMVHHEVSRPMTVAHEGPL